MDAGSRQDSGVDAGNRCDQPAGTFIACSTNCGLCTGEVAGYPLYSLQNPGCELDLRCSLPTRRACPTSCPPPTDADRGTPALFTLNPPFDAGPAITSVLTSPVMTSLLSLRAGARFVVVRPGDELAVCSTLTTEGLVLLFSPPSDGGAVGLGRFPTSSMYQPPEGTVVATVNSNRVALDGSVTLTSIGATVSGTFDLVLGGASTSGGVLQGGFEAVPCQAP